MEKVFKDAPDIIYADSRYDQRHPKKKKAYNTFSSFYSDSSPITGVIKITDDFMYDSPIDL